MIFAICLCLGCLFMWCQPFIYSKLHHGYFSESTSPWYGNISSFQWIFVEFIELYPPNLKTIQQNFEHYWKLPNGTLGTFTQRRLGHFAIRHDQMFNGYPSQEIFNCLYIRMNEWTDRCHKTNMPPQHLCSWGHRNGSHRYAIYSMRYTVELQWLKHWWLVYHGCFELVLESLVKNSLGCKFGII